MMRGMGRPSIYTRAIADAICARLAEGESLASICRTEGMPSSATVRDWIRNDLDGLSARSAQAYADGYEHLAEQCLQIADTPLKGEERTIKPDGTVEVKEGEMLGHRRLQIETRMRLLGKWAPKRYGERTELHHTGDGTLAETIAAARQRSGA